MNRWYIEIVPTNKYSYRINQVAFLFYSPLSFFVSKGSHYLLLFHFFHSFSSSFSSVFGLEWYQTPSLSPWVCLSYDLVESFTPIFFNYCDILAEMTWPKLSSRPSPPSAIIYSHIFFATGNQLSPQIPRKEKCSSISEKNGQGSYLMTVINQQLRMIVKIYHMIMLFHSLSLINERSSIMSIIVFVLSERDGKSNGSFSELCHAIVFLISTPRFLCLVLPSSDLLPIFTQTQDSPWNFAQLL